MNYIISGLPATGKTTICKNLVENLHLTYINDYEILKENGIEFKDILSKIYNVKG